jgi:hypothetical protein
MSSSTIRNSEVTNVTLISELTGAKLCLKVPPAFVYIPPGPKQLIDSALRDSTAPPPTRHLQQHARPLFRN